MRATYPTVASLDCEGPAANFCRIIPVTPNCPTVNAVRITNHAKTASVVMLLFYASETYAMAPANTKRRLAEAPAINPLMTASITYESASFLSASGVPPSWHDGSCVPTFPSASRPPSWHAWHDAGLLREPTSLQTRDPWWSAHRLPPDWQDSEFPGPNRSKHLRLPGSAEYPTSEPHRPNWKQTKVPHSGLRVPVPWAYELREP